MDDLKQTIADALKTAMKEKDALTRDVLRTINAAIKQVEVDERKTLSSAEVLDVLVREVKKRKDTIAELEAAGREDLLVEERAQLGVIERFLPQQLSREEVEAIVRETIAEVGATNPKEMGKVMGALMPKVKGKADGKLVNEVVRELLNN